MLESAADRSVQLHSDQYPALCSVLFYTCSLYLFILIWKLRQSQTNVFVAAGRLRFLLNTWTDSPESGRRWRSPPPAALGSGSTRCSRLGPMARSFPGQTLRTSARGAAAAARSLRPRGGSLFPAWSLRYCPVRSSTAPPAPPSWSGTS